jgi:arachidonate 15-lipoxygenase
MQAGLNTTVFFLILTDRYLRDKNEYAAPQTPSLPHGEQRSFLPDRDFYNFRPGSPLPSLQPVPQEVLRAYAPLDYNKPGFPRVPLTAQFTPTYLTSRLSLGSTLEPFVRLQNFEDFFPSQMYEPAIIKNYQTDFVFAEQRLSGANPMVLRRITHITYLYLDVSPWFLKLLHLT